jgi:hypothetical protein
MNFIRRLILNFLFPLNNEKVFIPPPESNPVKFFEPVNMEEEFKKAKTVEEFLTKIK